MAQRWTGLKSNRTIADITVAVGNKSVEIEENRATERQVRYYKRLLKKCIKYNLQIIRPSDLYESSWRKAYSEAIRLTIDILNEAGYWDGYTKEKKTYTHDSAKDKNRERSKRAFTHMPRY